MHLCSLCILMCSRLSPTIALPRVSMALSSVNYLPLSSIPDPKQKTQERLKKETFPLRTDTVRCLSNQIHKGHHLPIVWLPGEQDWENSGRLCYTPVTRREWTPVCTMSTPLRVLPFSPFQQNSEHICGRSFSSQRSYEDWGATAFLHL